MGLKRFINVGEATMQVSDVPETCQRHSRKGVPIVLTYFCDHSEIISVEDRPERDEDAHKELRMHHELDVHYSLGWATHLVDFRRKRHGCSFTAELGGYRPPSLKACPILMIALHPSTNSSAYSMVPQRNPCSRTTENFRQ